MPLVEALRPLREREEVIPGLTSSESSRVEVFEELLELLTRLSRAAPVVLPAALYAVKAGVAASSHIIATATFVQRIVRPPGSGGPRAVAAGRGQGRARAGGGRRSRRGPPSE